MSTQPSYTTSYRDSSFLSGKKVKTGNLSGRSQDPGGCQKSPVFIYIFGMYPVFFYYCSAAVAAAAAVDAALHSAARCDPLRCSVNNVTQERAYILDENMMDVAITAGLNGNFTDRKPN